MEQSKLNRFDILLGVIGFFVSLYALVLHLQLLLKPGHGLLCDISSSFNCSSVLSSSYSEMGSIPLGAYGMSYFIFVLAAAFLPKYTNATQKQKTCCELVLALIGFLVITTLFSISYFVLGVFCPVCVSVYTIVSLYFLTKAVSFFRMSKDPSAAVLVSDDLIKFVAVSLCLGIPPLAAGLIAPIAIPYFTKTNTDVQKVVAVEKKADAPQPSTELSFNKTNYVGDGQDYRLGDDNAKVVIQMFSDFGCPHCKSANESLVQAQQIVGKDKVLLVYRFFPLSNECNPYVSSKGWYVYGCSLVNMARCAGQQNQFWPFKEWAFSAQDVTDEKRTQMFSEAGIKQEVLKLGMNFDLFQQCVNSGVEWTKIKNDAALANRLGIQGTPLIFINGVKYQGGHSVDDFVQAIREAN